ncbi:MAG: TFIIH/NER complex subunit [Thelocarpon impressellum]|nr:MAG: TFIIH/NER complex subunit [Thelocarpon impressellum]
MARPGRQAASQDRLPGAEDGASLSLSTPLQALSLADGLASSDVCPVCKSSRYLNPSMRFLVNPECYHKMCESCVDRIFSHGPAPCPVAGCHRTLRKQRFRKQTFEDIHVEREVDVRKRVAKVYTRWHQASGFVLTSERRFNRRPTDFTSLRAYNDYLEEVETVTFNLLQRVDLPETEAKLAAYAAQNAASISHNVALQRHESESMAARTEAEKEQARLRRETARREQEEERKEKFEGKREVLDQLARGTGDAEKIAREGQKVILKRSTMRKSNQARAADAPPPSTTTTSSTDGGYFIKGLKPVAAPEPEKPFDPFGGFSASRTYFVQRDTYEHPWLDRARTDPSITAGGYDVREYHTRALVEAFSGLGVFVGEELGGEAA